MAGKFSEQEIRECIQFHQDELGKPIGEEEAVRFLEEIEEMKRCGEEASDHNFQMQQAEDTMWWEGVKALIQSGIKPLLVFLRDRKAL